MTNKLTREFMQNIISGHGFGVAPSAVKAMAEYIVAAMDSEPVAWEVKGILCHTLEEARKYVGVPEPLYYCHRTETTSSEPVAWLLSGGGTKDVVCFDSGNAYADPLREVTPLYRHAQQPVVPEKATVGEMPFLGTSEGVYVRGWNDCRAAMLQAGNSPVIPGWISVSERMPEENGTYQVWNGKHVGAVPFFFGSFQCLNPEQVTHWMPTPAAPQEVQGE